jgi:hypothetical protein
MDPNATLARIIEAAVAGDADELYQAAEDLTDWLERDGAPPDDPRPRPT